MDLTSIFAAVSGVIKLGQLALDAGKDAEPFFQMIRRLFEKDPQEVTQADLDKMAADSEKLADEMMLPISDDERQK